MLHGGGAVVEATEGWNATGFYLERGRYRFATAGLRSTPFGHSGPQGITPWRFVGDAFGRVVNLVERGLRVVLPTPRPSWPAPGVSRHSH